MYASVRPRALCRSMQQLEMEGKPAHREAASRVFFNDPNAHIKVRHPTHSLCTYSLLFSSDV